MTALILTLVFTAFIGILGQKLDFKNGINHTKTFGLSQSINWWSEGSVTLTSADLLGFEPKVIVHALHELCTVDLTACPPPYTVTSPQACFCKSRVGDRYDIHVGTQTTIALSGMTLQALVPGKGPLKNTFEATTLGRLPDMTESTSRVTASYTLDDGTPRDLLDAQQLSVCPDTWFRLDICVLGGSHGADLMVHVGSRTNIVKDDACIAISHKFRYGQDSKLIFQYKEADGCTQVHYIHLNEDAKACLKPSASAVPCSTTAAVEATTAATGYQPVATETSPTATDTTAETEITTDTASTKVGGVCPNSPRTITTLPSGLKTLTDNTSFNTSWTVFQRRVSNAVDFYRPWSNYVAGFGDVTDSYWLGLREVHRLCNIENKCELLIHLKYSDKPFGVSQNQDGCYYARYKDFWLSDAAENFTLTVGGYVGTAGDSLVYGGPETNLNQRPFTTFDRDHDQRSWVNCANAYHGAWWYSDCSVSNLNGRWRQRASSGAVWMTLTAWNAVEFSEMKLRRLG